MHRLSCALVALSLLSVTGCLDGFGGGGGGGEGEGEGERKYPAAYSATIDLELSEVDAVSDQTITTVAIVASFARDGDESEGSYSATSLTVAGTVEIYYSGEGGVVQHCTISDLFGSDVLPGIGTIAVGEFPGTGLAFLGTVDWHGYGTEHCEGRATDEEEPVSIHVSASEDYCETVSFVAVEDTSVLHYNDAVQCAKDTLDEITVTVDWTADAV